MKKTHYSFVALASLLFASATWSCSEDKTATEPAETRSAQGQLSAPIMPHAGGTMIDQLAASCPMVVPGTDVTVTDTEGGAALTFTTGGDVADLRTRVQHMAQMYEMHQGQAGLTWQHMGGQGMARGGPGMGGMGMAGDGMGHVAGRGPMPAASTTMTDSDSGARLEFRPTDPSQLGALRQQVRWHQERMHSGDCWMLQGQPTQTPPREEE